MRMFSYMTAQGRLWEHAAGYRCSTHLYCPDVPLYLNACGDVQSMWVLLESRQLGPDGLIFRTD